MTVDRLTRPLLLGAGAAAAAAMAGVLLLAGAALAQESPSPEASASPGADGGNAISIVDKTFQPADRTIHAGDVVSWTVTKAIGEPHSVTSGSPDNAPGAAFDSGVDLKAAGDSFSFTFANAGTYPYFCAVHPDTMTGTITVLAAGGEGEGSSDIGASKLLAAGILAIAILLFFGWARVYRRMNPAP